MFDYEDLDMHECDDFYQMNGEATVCDGDTITADEVID